MKKCWIAAGLAAAMMVTSLTGCGSSDGKKAVESAAVNVPTEPFGDTVKYDPSQPINEKTFPLNSGNGAVTICFRS